MTIDACRTLDHQSVRPQLETKVRFLSVTPLNIKLILSNFFIIQEQDLEGRGIKC